MTWVHDCIYAGGGAHIPDHWDDFAGQTGITAVVHLSPGRPTCFQGGPPRAFLWLSVADEAEAGGEERWLVGRFVDGALGEGRRVLLHSSLGRHRARWAFVAYRIYAGRSAASALREAAERPWLTPYVTDAAAWEAFADEVRARRA